MNSLSSSNSSIPCAQKSLTSKISSKTIGTDIYHSEESSSGEEVEKRGKAAKLSKLKTKVSNKHLELNGGEMACRFCNKVYKNLNLFERHVQACKEKNDNILIARANTLKVKSEESHESEEDQLTQRKKALKAISQEMKCPYCNKIYKKHKIHFEKHLLDCRKKSSKGEREEDNGGEESKSEKEDAEGDDAEGDDVEEDDYC